MDKNFENSSCKNDQMKVLRFNGNEPTKFRNSSYSLRVLEVLQSLRKVEVLCDIGLKTDDGIIVLGHKVVLASASPYFSAMFTSFKESFKDLVNIRELESTILQLLIDYIYTGEIIVTKENVKGLLPAANILQLDYVNSACVEFLQTQLDPSNCLDIKEFADLHSCMELLSSSEAYIKNDFYVAKCDEFLSLSSKEVIKLISCNDLFVPLEANLFTCVINWVKHELGCRKDSLAELMEHVHLPLMPKLFILNEVAEESLIKNNPKCNNYIVEALNFQKLKSQQRITIPQTIRSKPRQTLQQVFLLLSRRSICCTNWYDPATNLWTSGPDLFTSRETAGLVTIADQFVLALGGVNDAPSRSVEMLDVSLNPIKWVQMAWMLVGRKALGVGVINNCIYAVGGFDGKLSLNSAEVFDVSIQEWRMISSMAINRSCLGIGVLNNLLYAVGGYDHLTSQYLKSVECYDPSLDTWTQVADISACRSGVGIGVINGIIYAIGGFSGSKSHKSVEAYNPSTGVWTSVAKMHEPRAYAGVVALDDLLYVMGGINIIFPLKSFEIYNPTTNSWKLEIINSYNIGQIYAGVVFNRPTNFSFN